jgi:CO dehydrogenase maturation factor
MKGYPRKRGKTIAVTGKGGTGKTVFSTLMIKCLAHKEDISILAVDADSARSLPYTLGVPVEKTVSDYRQEIINNPGEKRRISDLNMGSVIREMVVSKPGFDLLVMGRPEAPGCFCAVNDLLRYGIETLSLDYDVTIIDGEAGPEQINRRVIQHLDALVVMADTSFRSLRTASEIMAVVQEQDIIDVGRTGLVINKCMGADERMDEITKRMDLNVWGVLPDDENVSSYDSLNKPLLDIPADARILNPVRSIMQNILGPAI